MNEFIKDIFFGGRGVEKFRRPQNKDYDELGKKENELFEKLKKALPRELFKEFTEFLEAVDNRYAILGEQYYIAGFKTGMRITFESFDLSDIYD